MASFARDLLNHKYYQDCNGGDKKVSLFHAVVAFMGDKGVQSKFLCLEVGLKLCESGTNCCWTDLPLLVWGLAFSSLRSFSLGAVELGHGSVVCCSSVTEQQRVALPANTTEGRVLAFCDLVTFAHHPYTAVVQLVILV